MQLKRFLMEEDGVGVIEVVLILVVLIGLVIVFKTQINKLLTGIFTEIKTGERGILNAVPGRDHSVSESDDPVCDVADAWAFRISQDGRGKTVSEDGV